MASTEAKPSNSPRAEAEAGFSLVEVLVALIVIAMLTSAVGGLIVFVVDLRDRTEETQHLGGAIDQLEAFRELLIDSTGSASEIKIQTPTASGFTLVGDGPGQAVYVDIHLLAKTPSDPPLIEARFGTDVAGRATTVDLSAFEAASIDYLSAQGDALQWRKAESMTGAALAARLTLNRGVRQWSILLWIVPRAPGSSPLGQ